MDRVLVQDWRLFPLTPTRPAGRGLVSGVVAIAMILGVAGCSTLPDSLNPVEWARSAGAVFDDGGEPAQRPVPGADRPFPNLASVPSRPAVTPVGDRERITEGLRADRENARYADTALRQPAASSAATLATPPAVTQASPQIPPAPSRIPVEPTPPVRSADPVPPPSASAAPAVTPAPQKPVVREVLRAQTVEPAAGNPSPPAAPPRAAVPEPQATAPMASPGEPQVAAVETRSDSRAESQEESGEQGVSYRAAVIYFDQDSASLAAPDIAAIREVARFHRETGGVVRVIGHAAGDAGAVSGPRHRDATLRVSTERAEAVARQLVQFGVPQRSVTVRGVGDGEPVVGDGAADAAARNRRAEVYIDY